MPSTVILSIKGEVRKVNVSSDLTMESLQKVFKKKDVPERVCYYEYDDKIIFIFGYKKGKKGTENKTELPDPHASTVLYGDALVIVSMNDKWENPVPFTVEQWNAFYNCEEKEKDDKEDKDDKEEEEEEILYDDEVKDDFDVEIPDEVEEEEEVKPVRKKACTCV